jgi:hypothetical protein
MIYFTKCYHNDICVIGPVLRSDVIPNEVISINVCYEVYHLTLTSPH